MIGYFSEIFEVIVSMLYSTPPGSPCGSPRDFQIPLFPGTPPRALFESDDGEDFTSSPSKFRKTSESESCPKAPTRQRKQKGPIEGLPILSDDSRIRIRKIDEIGEGSFGIVFSVICPGTPDYMFAMKEVAVSGRSSPSDLCQEAANFGKPGCVPGFAMSSPKGDKCYLFSPICDPLDKTNQVNGENIEEMISELMKSIMEAPFPVITDAGLSNMGFAPAGTPTPVSGENGLPCAGDPIPKDCVLFLDIGNNDPNDCNPMTSALFDEDEMNTEEEQLQYRKFKCDLIAALLRNRILDLEVRRDECDIARKICEKYGYTYAGGNRKQSDF